MSLLLIGLLPFGKNPGGFIYIFGSPHLPRGSEVTGGHDTYFWGRGGCYVLLSIGPGLLDVVVISISDIVLPFGTIGRSYPHFLFSTYEKALSVCPA